MSDDAYASFEFYLETAPPLYYFKPPDGGGGHPDKFGVTLMGGVSLIGKPASGVREGDGERIVKSEAAGWQAAKLLYVADLVSATVVRSFTLPTATTATLCSVQVIWADPSPGHDLDQISEEQILRAGTFDFVTAAVDRNASNNWLYVRCAITGVIRIMLIDNGWSFGARNGNPSVFVDKARGKPLNAGLLEGVENLRNGAGAGPLATLLDEQQVGDLVDRCTKVLAAGAIP